MTRGVREPRGLWIVALLLAIGTLALYWPVHAYDFVSYDDGTYVRSNVHVRSGLTLANVAWAFTTMHAGLWIPLTWLSLMLDAQLFGPSAGGFHATNVVLHAANTALLFALLVRLTERPWASAVVAGLFAVHPLHVESVAWITERKDVLSTLFLLLTLGSYARWVRAPAPQRYALTLLSLAAGLMAKPMVMTVPMLLLLLDVWPLGRTASVPARRLLLEKVPFGVLAAAAAVVTFVAQRRSGAVAPIATLSLWVRVANAFESWVAYLTKTVWPVGLAAFYPYPGPPVAWRAALSGLGLAATTLAAVRSRRRAPYVTMGWLWYLTTLLPVIGLVQVGPQAMADRFTYVPLIGVFVIAAWGAGDIVARWRRGGIALAAVAGAAVIASAALSVRQLRYWRDGVTLFEHAIAVTGPNPVGVALLGRALSEAGRAEEAMARYDEALRLDPQTPDVRVDLAVLLMDRGRFAEARPHLEAALAQRPDDAYARTNLASVFEKLGETEHAVAQAREAVRLDSDAGPAHNNLGRLLAAQGKLTDAVVEYSAALALQPDDADAHGNLANALAAQGKTAEAMQHFAEALRLRPTHAATHVNYGLLLAELGRPADAIHEYQLALATAPDDHDAHLALANALAMTGRFDDAIGQYTESLRLSPADAHAESNLGNALAMAGHMDEAIPHYEEALRLEPGYAEAHHNLGMVLAAQGRLDEAVAHYATAVRLKPDYVDAHTHLGMTLARQGKLDAAIAEYTAALQIAPDDVTAREQLDLLRAGR